MLAFTKGELKSHHDAKECYICGKRTLQKLSKSISYQKVRDHYHYTEKYKSAVYFICNLKYNGRREIPVAFHKDSNYDYHFITKELGSKFEEKFECLRKNAKTYKTVSVPIEKEVLEIDKDGNESVVTISYKTKFIDSARFMAISLSNLFDNLIEKIHKIKFKNCDCFLEYESAKDNLIK